jgi:hypothetical protein
MFKSLSEYLENKSKNGINFFFANDPIEKKPSSTLFYAYISFWGAIASLLALHFDIRVLPATIAAMVFNAMMIIFYMIRRINKASVNFKDGKVDVANNESDK